MRKLTLAAATTVTCLAILSTLGFVPAPGQPSDASASPREQAPQQAEVSPCVVTHTLSAHPDVLLLGEEITATLGVRASCPDIPDPLHLVLVLDGSGSMQGQKTRQMKQATYQFARDLDLPGRPDRKVGVVEFNTQARRLCPLTNDHNRVISCVNRIGANGGTAIDKAILEGLRVLADGRPPVGPDAVTEVMIVLTDGGNNGGCPPVMAAANQASSQGVMVIAICYGPDCDAQCMRMVAGAPDLYHQAQDGPELEVVYDTILRSILSEVSGSGVRLVGVTDAWGARFDYVADSATPEQTAPDVPAEWLTWEHHYLPVDGVTFSLRLRPLSAGVQPAGQSAEGELTDVRGRRRSWRFEVPDITVLAPGPVPSPAPTSTYVAPSATPSATALPSATPTVDFRAYETFLPRSVRGVP